MAIWITIGVWTLQKIKHGKAHGQWLKGRISSQMGAICILDIGTNLLRVNQSKLRKAHDDWSDVDVPLEEEAVVDIPTLSCSVWLAPPRRKRDVQDFFRLHAPEFCLCWHGAFSGTTY